MAVKSTGKTKAKYLELASISLTVWAMSSCLAADAAEEKYFPAKMSYSSDKRMAQYLSVLGEKPILKLRNQFVFRLLYLRAYEHPICLRLEGRRKGNLVLFIKESNGAGGFEPGKLIINRKTDMNAARRKEFLSTLEKINFFKQPLETKVNGDELTLGGSVWLFEINDNGRYHCLYRDTDTYAQGSMSKIAMMLLEEAGCKDKLKNCDRQRK